MFALVLLFISAKEIIMTKKRVQKEFEDSVLPFIKDTFENDGKVDHNARAQAWNDFTDSLCKDGTITQNQYSTWSNPY